MARILLGLGTGRCGTVTLTRLLEAQSGVVAAHESWSPVPWDGEIGLWVGKIVGKSDECPEPVLAEVAFYWLPYAHALLEAQSEAKVVVLKRPRDEVIASYLRKTGPSRNHWSLDGCYPHDPWNQAYPSFDCEKEEAIGRYWDGYYAACDELRQTFTGRVHEMLTPELNDAGAVSELLRFAEIGDPDLSLVGTKFNAS